MIKHLFIRYNTSFSSTHFYRKYIKAVISEKSIIPDMTAFYLVPYVLYVTHVTYFVYT